MPNPLKQIGSLVLDYKEQWVVYTGIVLISVLAWWYLADSHRAMYFASSMTMWMPPSVDSEVWRVHDFAMLFAMWAVMMLAMMLPTSFPLVTVYMSLHKQKSDDMRYILLGNILLSGYVFAWLLFSVVATLLQYPLHRTGILSPMMESHSMLFSGGVLLLAGIYQWTPMKTACLDRCRSPLGFLIQHWTDRALGAFAMGTRYGLFCIGCCWALMFLMLALGMMNVLWMAVITLFILVEKLMPHSSLVRIFAGIAFVLWGGYWLGMYFLPVVL